MKNPKPRTWLAVLAGLLLLFQAATARAFDATDKYEVRQLDGWTLRIHQDLLKNPALATNTLRELEHQFYQIERAVPAPAVAKLRAVTIWIELSHPLHPCMCYHPSPEWLREHDMNPAKARGVEISNARNFLSWTHEQPWMVLHELAHAYHHQVLGYDHPDIKAAFEKAKASQRYEQVLRFNGKLERHYALNNEQEYFAEATEAWFGVNDFFPFVRSELKQHDPDIAAVLAKLWYPETPQAQATPPAIVPAKQ